jgi:hypothetical protein
MTASTKQLPRGSEFFKVAATVETQCAELSLGELPKLGISAPACYEFLGNVLSMLYEEASCFHACDNSDHLIQRLTARIVTHSLSSLRLATFGYYDESLALTRNVGEIANLLFLFAAQPDSLQTWRLADEQKRKREFGPVKVRLKLEQLNLVPPIDESRYGLLCEVGVHAVPSISPQNFNEHNRPTVGAKFQDTGLICTLNELSVVVAESAACLSTFPNVGDRAAPLRIAAELLLNVVGNLDLAVARGNGGV